MKQGWEYKKLGEVADFYRGLTYGKNDEAEFSNVCVLRSNNIDLDSMSLNFDEIKYLRPDFVIPEDKKLKGNSIFICMSNGSKQHVGKVAFIPYDMNFAFGGFMGLIVPYKDVSAKYIYYVCRSSLYRNFLLSIGNGIGITNLKFSDLINFSFPIFELSIQQQIVSELDLLSGVIEKQKAQLEELDKLAQSIFYDMFGDPVTNEKEWDKITLNKLATFKNGINFHANEVGNEIKCIGVGDFKDNTEISNFEWVRTLQIQEMIDEDYYLSDGDILIVRSNGSKDLVGRNMIVYTSGEKVTYSGFCIRCRVNVPTILPLFLNRIMSDKSIMSILRQEGRGCNISNINQKILSSLYIILPPLALQQKFAAKVEQIESMKAKVRLSLTEAETLFNSRMDYYFN